MDDVLFLLAYVFIPLFFLAVCVSVVIALVAIVGVVILRRRREALVVPVGSHDRLVGRTDVEDR
jgi:hypothetical protein